MTLPALSTERLWLRTLGADDASDLHVAFGDSECMRWWHRPWCRSLEESGQAVADMLAQDAGHWVFGEHGSGEVLGHVGFIANLAREGHAGFGYGLRRSHWGRGLAPEACTAALDWAFDHVGIARVELWIHRDNHRSVRVAEKLGCKRRGEAYLNYAVGPTPSLIYGLTGEQWRGEAEPPPRHYAVISVLAVSDVAGAVQWWRDVAGFHTDFIFGDPPEVARVTPDPPWAGRSSVQLSRAAKDDAGRGSVYIVVGPGIDQLAESAVASGTRVITPLGDRPWGMREIELEDPDGNRIRFASPV